MIPETSRLVISRFRSCYIPFQNIDQTAPMCIPIKRHLSVKLFRHHGCIKWGLYGPPWNLRSTNSGSVFQSLLPIIGLAFWMDDHIVSGPAFIWCWRVEEAARNPLVCCISDYGMSRCPRARLRNGDALHVINIFHPPRSLAENCI